MNTAVVIQQMLVLFAMMVAGYLAYRCGWLNDEACSKLSTMIVHVLNPAIIINGVLGKDSTEAGALIGQNILLILLMFAILIAVSFPLVRWLRIAKKDRGLYQMMTIFSNVGFMGIPVVSSIYGSDAIIYVSFYILIYNVLIYTFGVWLIGRDSEQGVKLEWKKILNTGVIACLIAIVVFVFQIPTPDPVNTFMSYMGNAAIPLSMMIIGASVAQADWRVTFGDAKLYLYSAVKLLVLPSLTVLLVQFLPFDPMLEGILIIMMAMPVGSIVALMAQEYGADNALGSRGIVMTTVLCVATLPAVSLFRQWIEMLMG